MSVMTTILQMEISIAFSWQRVIFILIQIPLKYGLQDPINSKTVSTYVIA